MQIEMKFMGGKLWKRKGGEEEIIKKNSVEEGNRN